MRHPAVGRRVLYVLPQNHVVHVVHVVHFSQKWTACTSRTACTTAIRRTTVDNIIGNRLSFAQVMVGLDTARPHRAGAIVSRSGSERRWRGETGDPDCRR
jgi:hypothetical protein